MTQNETSIKNNNEKTDTNATDILANKMELADMKDNIINLTKENERLAKSLDDQIDRSMRETLMFGGIGGKER